MKKEWINIARLVVAAIAVYLAWNNQQNLIREIQVRSHEESAIGVGEPVSGKSAGYREDSRPFAGKGHLGSNESAAGKSGATG